MQLLTTSHWSSISDLVLDLASHSSIEYNCAFSNGSSRGWTPDLRLNSFVGYEGLPDSTSPLVHPSDIYPWQCLSEERLQAFIDPDGNYQLPTGSTLPLAPGRVILHLGDVDDDWLSDKDRIVNLRRQFRPIVAGSPTPHPTSTSARPWSPAPRSPELGMSETGALLRDSPHLFMVVHGVEQSAALRLRDRLRRITGDRIELLDIDVDGRAALYSVSLIAIEQTTRQSIVRLIGDLEYEFFCLAPSGFLAELKEQDPPSTKLVAQASAPPDLHEAFRAVLRHLLREDDMTQAGSPSSAMAVEDAHQAQMLVDGARAVGHHGYVCSTSTVALLDSNVMLVLTKAPWSVIRPLAEEIASLGSVATTAALTTGTSRPWLTELHSDLGAPARLDDLLPSPRARALDPWQLVPKRT